MRRIIASKATFVMFDQAARELARNVPSSDALAWAKGDVRGTMLILAECVPQQRDAKWRLTTILSKKLAPLSRPGNGICFT